MEPYYKLKEEDEEWGPSRHFTNVFNVFVWLQIAGMINARKIRDERNPFSGITLNIMYLIIFFIICGCQVIIVIFGGVALKVSSTPIAGEQWGIAFAFAFGMLVWDWLVRFIPITMFP